MTDTLDQILAFHDAGNDVPTTAASCSVSPGYVYGILRTHRPKRTRKPRARTSAKRRMILGLLAQGFGVARVAFLCQCTRAWVYKVMDDAE